MALNEKQKLNSAFTNIPNDVSGDGKLFVSALKNYLKLARDSATTQVESAVSQLGVKPNHVTSVQLAQTNTLSGNATVYNIFATWSNTGISRYNGAEVWYKTSGMDDYELAGKSSGTSYTFANVTSGGVYYLKVVATNDSGLMADFTSAPSERIKITGTNLYKPDRPSQIVLEMDEDGPIFQWTVSSSSYVEEYELRTDQNYGVLDGGYLDRTKELYSRKVPQSRSGRVYIYAKGAGGVYSDPLGYNYSVSQPSKPSNPIVLSVPSGIQITMDQLPIGCTSYQIYISRVQDGQTLGSNHETTSREYFYNFYSGYVSVRYRFKDCFGGGAWTEYVKTYASEESRTVHGIAEDGKLVTFTNEWQAVPNVIVSPVSILSSEHTLVCEAQDITKSGFTMVCKTVDSSGVTQETGKAMFVAYANGSDGYTTS